MRALASRHGRRLGLALAAATASALLAALAAGAPVASLDSGPLLPSTTPAPSAGGALERVTASYRQPPRVLADLADTPPLPQVLLDPSHRWVLVLQLRGLPPIAELAQRELRLAGLRINPQTDALSRRGYVTGIRLLRLADLAAREVRGLPEEPRIGAVTWSPDGAFISFTHTRADGNEIWAVELATGQARRLSAQPLSLVVNRTPQWFPDSRSLLCALVPAERGGEPPAPPLAPLEEETAGRAAPARTDPDLLKNPHDEALFEHFLTVRMARIGLDGSVTPLGSAGLHRVSLSPDGNYLLTETLHRPFSHLVPWERFPRRIEVWDAHGTPVRQLADVPLAEAVPIGTDNVPVGPRALRWRDDAPATVAWVEALDGGDAGRVADPRDRVYLLPAPFGGQPRVLADLSYRFSGAAWGNDRLAVVGETWRQTRRLRLWLLRAGRQPEILADCSTEDRYGDPGDLLLTTNRFGRTPLRLGDGGRTVYFLGAGASPEGDRPFVDALDLGGPGPHSRRRLFRSRPPFYEEPLELLDPAGYELLLRRESAGQPPNYFVRNLKAGALRQITFFPHPAPQLAGISRELIRYRRADGLPLAATLFLPAGYRAKNGALPMVVFAYPQDFQSAAAAGQVTGSPHRFEQVAWNAPILWAARGYAVLENPSMPIVGTAGAEPNDTYVQQLVDDATAVVEETVRRGVAERGRIAIVGRSYGAFTVANLLAHSRLFAAGIALNGAYNRTLTPFGFQTEERTLWQARTTYLEMSPFLSADKVAAPLLLIHGQADNNAGTDPIQSERFFAALKGLGATARLVMLPYESHAYQARESILHVLAEMDCWLEIHLRHRTCAARESLPPKRRDEAR